VNFKYSPPTHPKISQHKNVKISFSLECSKWVFLTTKLSTKLPAIPQPSLSHPHMSKQNAFFFRCENCHPRSTWTTGLTEMVFLSHFVCLGLYRAPSTMANVTFLQKKSKETSIKTLNGKRVSNAM
jgi:hypothetical protein